MKTKIKVLIGVLTGSLLVLFLVLLASVASATDVLYKTIKTEADWDIAYSLLAQIEAENRNSEIGDIDHQNKVYGILQIGQPYLTDALEWAYQNPHDENAELLVFWDLKHGGITAKDLLSANPAVSYAIMRCYMARYAGLNPTVEMVLRIHKGGGPSKGESKWVIKTESHIAKAKRHLVAGMW